MIAGLIERIGPALRRASGRSLVGAACLCGFVAAALHVAEISTVPPQPQGGLPGSPPSYSRAITPEDQDAIRPAFSSDGRRLAYVRVPGRAAVAAGAAGSGGEEIWVVDLETAESRRRVGPPELSAAGFPASGYSLGDLAWSPDGSRLAFTWFDGRAWSHVALANADGSVVPLSATVMAEPSAKGPLFDVSASQFLWNADARGGTFAGWDDECGSLFGTPVPAEGEWGGVPVPSAAEVPGAAATGETGASGMQLLTPEPGCRPVLLGTTGFWTYAQDGDGSSRELRIITTQGLETEALAYPQGSPLRLRWGLEESAGGSPESAPSASRPTVLGWRYETDRAERALFSWGPGGVTEWSRGPSADGDGAGAVAMTTSGILFLDGPPGGAHLVGIRSPGEPGIELLPAPVEEIVASRDGTRAVAVWGPPGARSLRLLDPAMP